MLGRTASSLYWMSRYMERAENLARLLEVGHRISLMPGAVEGHRDEWRSTLLSAACELSYQAKHKDIIAAQVIDFLIFDESVSALDVSVQAGILNLINELKNELNFTSLFISHDLSVVHYISDRILIMNKGKIIESGKAGDVFLNPAMKYTRELIDAIPGKNLA